MIGRSPAPASRATSSSSRPGTKVGKVAALKDDLAYALATTEIRILAPIPGKQAVGVEVPNLSPNIVTLGDIFADMPAGGEPALGLARQGHLRPGRLDRPRADAAHPDRRHDRLGQVGVHQQHALLDPPPRDAGRRADDPRRPEARRADLYESIPHLLTPVVSSPKAAAAVLANVVSEMERRYERMSVARARSLPRSTGRWRSAASSRCRTCWS